MKKWFLLSFFSSIIIVNANAKDKNNIVFDYSDMSLSSIGIYNPKLEGEKTGLNAELIARKNGIDNLEKYFESCSRFIIPTKAGLRIALNLSRESYNEYKKKEKPKTNKQR